MVQAARAAWLIVSNSIRRGPGWATTQNLRDGQLGPGGVVRDQPASPVLQLKSVIGCGNAFGFGVWVFPGYRFYSRSSARSENRVARRGTTSGERLVK